MPFLGGFQSRDLVLEMVSFSYATLVGFSLFFASNKLKTKLRGVYSASELYRPSDRRLSAKFVPTFADRGCRVVSATDPPGR
jgi:hypothetical protein